MTSVPRPARTCLHPGCRHNATDHGHCTQHHKEATTARLASLHATRSELERRNRYGAAWRTQRTRILNRDGHACVYCGTSERLEVHHLANTDRPHDDQLVTLCYRHHRAIEAEGKRGQVGKVGQTVAQWINKSKGNR